MLSTFQPKGSARNAQLYPIIYNGYWMKFAKELARDGSFVCEIDLDNDTDRVLNIRFHCTSWSNSNRQGNEWPGYKADPKGQLKLHVDHWQTLCILAGSEDFDTVERFCNKNIESNAGFDLIELLKAVEIPSEHKDRLVSVYGL